LKYILNRVRTRSYFFKLSIKTNLAKKALKQVGIKQIAAEANVSIGTVDRVIHKRPGVSENTRQKVLSIIDKHGYQRNTIASRLASKKLIKILALIPDPKETDYWKIQYNALLQAAEEYAQLGFSLTCEFFSLQNPASYSEQCTKIQTSDYDGMITAGLFPQWGKDLWHEFQSLHKPVVFIDTRFTESKDFYNIYQNGYQGGQVAGRLMLPLIEPEKTVLLIHLESKHHRNINDNERSKGFIDFLSERNALLNFHHITTSFSGDPKLAETLHTIFNQMDITGVFVPNSRSHEICSLKNKLGIKSVPIIGFDVNPRNMHFMQLEDIDFLIHQKPEEQATRAVQVMANLLIHHRPIHDREHHVPIEIVVKESIPSG
jgi:LacI family transcriptional regulator